MLINRYTADTINILHLRNSAEICRLESDMHATRESLWEESWSDKATPSLDNRLIKLDLMPSSRFDRLSSSRAVTACSIAE
ncbi:hypothetical protein HN011_001109, partial [Eciton burchellii]